MSKPLTIEELKALPVGDWVWVVNLQEKSGVYHRKSFNSDKELLVISIAMAGFPYYNYGKTWIAYKNKEQAEGKDENMIERIEKAYEHNVAECERCMNKVDMKHQFAMESMKEHIRKETAKEILTTLKDWFDRNTPIAVDVQEIAEKYGVEVDG